jgi:FtsP/CotA-like multicopper oxidase with cupredoxin domain
VSELPPAQAPARRDTSTWPLIFGTLAALAIAFGLAVTAVVYTNKDDDGAASAATAPASATVSLTEFAIGPSTLTVAQGGSLEVSNDGSAAHNLAVTDTDLKTPDLNSGDAASLDVSSLAAGSYEVLCLIPGHADAGMRGTLQVSAGGAAVGAPPAVDSDHSAHGDTMDYQQMTDDMLASASAFPAETEGQGNQLLEPTEVRADGTKVFDLTMEIGDWEVEPGKVVEAWTFNGMVPAPLMKLAVGDKVEVRVKNDLPIATDVHWHGLKNDNRFDGVAPYTQDLIEPGDTFTYEVATVRPGVSMYHPHAHGHMLLPNGMFGGVLVGQMPLPAGQQIGWEQVPADVQVAQEIPMVLNDSGVIGFSLNGKSFPATEPYTGKVGDFVLIHYFNEGNQIHPMHLHQFDQIVIAKDGSPLEQPYVADTLNVAPGERYSVLVELDKPGTWVWHCHILPHVERDAGMFGMVTAFIVE